MVNAFEATLAIYFLDREIINQLWVESENKERPESLESVVSVPGWPKDFDVPKECEGQFSFDDRVIRFEDVMTEVQKEALRKRLDSQYMEAVETLFSRSRFIDKESTL